MLRPTISEGTVGNSRWVSEHEGLSPNARGTRPTRTAFQIALAISTQNRSGTTNRISFLSYLSSNARPRLYERFPVFRQIPFCRDARVHDDGAHLSRSSRIISSAEGNARLDSAYCSLTHPKNFAPTHAVLSIPAPWAHFPRAGPAPRPQSSAGGPWPVCGAPHRGRPGCFHI